MQSLALKYRATVEKLEELTGKSIPVIHMVGGGIKDKTLCRYTAGATGRTGFAGPVEATSAGNLMIQAMAPGFVADLQEARRIVSESFPSDVYKPENTPEWKRHMEDSKRYLVQCF
jgi:sugar (pentulose or hexulose) kinase